MSSAHNKKDWLLDHLTTLSDEDKLAFELLFKKFPLRPIRNADQNRRAMALADELLSRRDDLSAVERDYLEVLGQLIHKFESEAYAEDDIPFQPNELIRSLIEDRGLKQAELARELGVPQSRLSEYLNGKRKASKSLARKLASYFALSLDVLLGDAESDDSFSVAEDACDSQSYVTRKGVFWDTSEPVYAAIEKAANEAGVSFEAYVKVVMYQAAHADTPTAKPLAISKLSGLRRFLVADAAPTYSTALGERSNVWFVRREP